MSNRSKKNGPRVPQANRWEVAMCGDGHTVLQLLDPRGKAFAEAHGFDPEELIRALMVTKLNPAVFAQSRD